MYNKKVASNTEDYITKHANITTKLQLKLFVKVIKRPSKELGFQIDRESN
jgi:hypothetical protein